MSLIDFCGDVHLIVYPDEVDSHVSSREFPGMAWPSASIDELVRIYVRFRLLSPSPQISTPQQEES